MSPLTGLTDVYFGPPNPGLQQLNHRTPNQLTWRDYRRHGEDGPLPAREEIGLRFPDNPRPG